MKRLALLQALLTSLTFACISAPLPEPAAVAVEIPGAWSSGVQTAPLTQSAEIPWWKAFGDPTLEALIAEALRRNGDLRAAVAAVDEAAALARIAGAERVPRLDLGVDGSRRQQVFVGLPIPGQEGVLKSISTAVGFSLDVSWEIDLWGRVRAAGKAAQHELEAVRHEAMAARLSLTGQVVKIWLSLIEAKAQRELAEGQAESRRATLEHVAARFQSGIGEALEVRLARVELYRAESVLAWRQRRQDHIHRQLEALVGRYPRAALEGPSSLPELPSSLPAGLPAEIITRRPDLVAHERRLVARGWRLAEARTALFPRLRLTAGGGGLSDDVSSLLDSDYSIWSLAGNLLQPIFQGGRLRAAVELAAASRERVLAEYAQAILDAFAEVESALAADSFLAAELGALELAAEEARAAAELAESRYRDGLGTYLELLESARQAVSVDSAHLAVRRQLLTGRVDLYLALGGETGLSTATMVEDDVQAASDP